MNKPDGPKLSEESLELLRRQADRLRQKLDAGTLQLACLGSHAQLSLQADPDARSMTPCPSASHRYS